VKIAFIGGFAFSPKGTVRARALPLASELVGLGHEVTIFLTPYDNLGDAGREWMQDGVRICNMGSASTNNSVKARPTYLTYLRMLRQMISDVTHYSPDLIHIFKPKGFAGAAGTYFLVRGRRPVVLDCDDWEGWGGWNEVKAYPWLVKEYIDRQERWMVRRAPAVTAASRVLEKRAAELRGSGDAVYYLPNCGARDTKDYQRVRENSQDKIKSNFGLPQGLTVLYAGHFEAGEDAGFFCRAAASVAEELDASIVFVGEGPGLPEVKEFFSSRPRVRAFFFPQLPHQKFLELIQAADVAAFPYPDDPLHRAKCSARIIDYMAMGKAVLTSAVGENCEFIVDGESGVLARPGDEGDFAAKLELLLRNSPLRLKLGQNAEERVRSKFTWRGDALQQCLAAYEHALHHDKQANLSHARCPESSS
jgi:glycosyltransferase involved in cell wall biosynthesis